MPLYFAYGSNMDTAAMAARCPRSTPAGLARLPRHRFALMKQGFATVARDPRREVWGLLWTLALADIPALDRWEDVSRGLYEKTTQPVVRAGGSAVRALIYVAGPSDGLAGAPASRGYGEGVVSAARAIGLPAGYVSDIERIFGARRTASGGTQ